MDDTAVVFAPIAQDENAIVRQRMLSGQLPRGPAQELFGRRGTGAQCSCCDQVITTDQIEFEIHACAPESEHSCLMMHSHCMRIWYDEWDR